LNKSAFSIYDASAGSGKTFTLVKEYLKIILTSTKEDAYKNILAITFTNKAVGEMKSRVLDALSEFSKESPDAKAVEMMRQIQEESQLSEKAIHYKSKAIIRNIIHNYAAFDISTIDKFTHKVIRTFAHDLNLPATFEVSLETDNLLVEAIDALIAQVGEDAMLTKLLVDFTLEKADDDKSWDVSRDIKEIAKLLTNENSRQEIEHFKEKSISEFVSLKESLISQVKEIESFCVEQAGMAFQIIQEQQLDETAFTRKVVYNYFSSFSKGKITNNPKIREYLTEGNRYSKSIPQFQKDAVDAIAPKLLFYFEEIDAKIKNHLLYTSFLKNINPLSLLNQVSQELHKIQEEQNILSISEFNSIIHNEIQKQPAPFIYERMGERYKHFFIDEFQDTSQMQWENLIPLIDNALSSEDLQGERGTLMIVGDPKQSIYRWRGGKAEQFIELSKSKNPFVNPDKSIHKLDTNWRSYSEIIDFNNNFFKFIATSFQNPDYKDLYENHSFQKKNNKKGGFVNLSFIPAKEKTNTAFDKDELYLDAIKSTIDRLLSKHFTYRDIVVLTRKKDPAIKIATFLTENGIPIVSSETLLLQNSAEVQLVLHVLRYVKNDSDNESKANFLHYIGTHLQQSIPVHDFIFQGMKYQSDIELEKWLLTFGLKMSFQLLRKKALFEVVEIIISSFIQPKETNAYLQDFLDRVLEHDIKKRSGISDFLEYWDNNASRFSIPSPEGNNAIRIMTIHKAKGLEFPVVIFPFAEESYSNAPKDKLWIEPQNEQIPLNKILVDNNKSVEELGESALLVYQQKKEEELLDNINILYVALTRAEEQLYIISSMNVTSTGELVSNNMSTFFLNYLRHKGLFNSSQLNYQWGKEERVSSAGKAVQSIQPIGWIQNTLPAAAIKIVHKESLMWGTHQQKAIEYGNVIHEILSYVKTIDDIDLAITKSLESGLINSGQKNEVTDVLYQICTHPELIDFFQSDLKILNEQTIIRKSDSLIKPDRIVITANGEAMLVDYKTGEPNSKHRKQLEIYEQALETMGFSVIKKALVYIGETLKIVTL
jgi:ATP-dependent exoDNAse (exonuclease V) beta subunit